METAVALFRRQGYAKTGLNEVVARSGAPKGSLYHYFPRGKDQLGEEAVRFAGARVARTLEELAAQHGDAGALVRAYANLLAGWIAKSGFRDGCPITTTILETVPMSDTITEAGREAFAAWRGVLADALMRSGAREADARRLARFAISALEGALIQARVEGRADPLVEAGAELANLFAASTR